MTATQAQTDALLAMPVTTRAEAEAFIEQKPKCGHGNPVDECAECDRIEEAHREADSDARWNAGNGR